MEETDLPLASCYSVVADSDPSAGALSYRTVETSPAGYEDVFVIDEDTGVFDCQEVALGLEQAERVTLVVAASNDAGDFG